MKIVMVGGHLTPALALIDYIRSHHQDDQIHFLGRKYSQERIKQLAREQEEVERRQVKFTQLYVPRFNKNSLPILIGDAIFYPFSVLKSIIFLIFNRPDILVSFGGYLAIPPAISAWLLRIPIVTHEQTTVAGSANEFIAKLAQKVAISFAGSGEYFPKNKVVNTGNPVRAQLKSPSTTKPSWLETKLNKPLVLITGGNQGSYTINRTVSRALNSLTKKYIIVHACGKSSSKVDYKKDLLAKRDKLPQAQQKNYYVQEWLSEDELSWILSKASCVVSRAGANTIYELIITRTPAVIIPLPFAKKDEQTKNAKLITDSGGAKLLPQSKLTSTNLLKEIQQVVKFNKSMSKKISAINITTDGARQLYEVLEDIVNKK